MSTTSKLHPNSWIPGKVTEVTGRLTYHIEVQPGKVVHRHVDAVRQCTVTAAPLPQPQEVDTPDCLEDIYLQDVPTSRSIVAPSVPPELPSRVQSQPANPRRSARHRPPPDYCGRTW